MPTNCISNSTIGEQNLTTHHQPVWQVQTLWVDIAIAQLAPCEGALARQTSP